MTNGAIADAGITAADEGLRWKPATRMENACASGSAALYSAAQAIKAGEARIALVIGAEKMTNNSTAEVGVALAGASYQREEAGKTFPQIFAMYAQAYFEAYGDHSGDLAMIAAPALAHAVNDAVRNALMLGR